MVNTVASFKRIFGEDIKTNHKTYVPPEGMSIIYLQECPNPKTGEVFNYVGSTKDSLKVREGKLYVNYHYGPNTKSKFNKYLLEFGCYLIKSKILDVVDDEIRAQVEQEEIEKYNAIDLGFNTYRAVKEIACPAKIYDNASKASEKNQPREISVESYQIVCEHRDKSVSSITINKGLYEHHFSKLVLCLDTPGMKGSLVAHPMVNGKQTSKTALRYLAEDLELNLKFGPEGRHMITLDNIYIVGTKTNLRSFLDQNPIYIKKVSYLTFGEWDAEKIDC